MNFTYTLIKPPDEQWGTIQPDGTWSGMVNLLANQDIDIAATLFAVTEERSTVMTFTNTISESYHSLFPKFGKYDVNLLMCSIIQRFSIPPCRVCINYKMWPVYFLYTALQVSPLLSVT